MQHRANPIDGSSERYCTFCHTYHGLSAFSPKTLGNRIYKCRVSTAASSRQYRQFLSPKTRKCRRLLSKIRKRLDGPLARQVQVQDVESVVTTLYEEEGSDGSGPDPEGWRFASVDMVFEALRGMLNIDTATSSNDGGAAACDSD